MPVYTKKDGRIFCVYYDGGRRVWEPFGRGKIARRKAELRDLEIKLTKKRIENKGDDTGKPKQVIPPIMLTYEKLVHIYT